MSPVLFGCKWKLSSVLLIWEICWISCLTLEEYVHGRRWACISPSFLMKNSQVFTGVVCDHVNDRQVLLPALHCFPETYSETSTLCRWIRGYSWMIPIRKWGREDWAKGKPTCTAVIVEGLANSMQSSGAGKDLWYCPKLRKCGYIFVSFHQQQVTPERDYNPDWGSFLWLQATPSEGCNYNQELIFPKVDGGKKWVCHPWRRNLVIITDPQIH